MLADGRLHLSGLVALSAYLTSENGEALLAAAAHKSKTCNWSSCWPSGSRNPTCRC